MANAKKYIDELAKEHGVQIQLLTEVYLSHQTSNVYYGKVAVILLGNYYLYLTAEDRWYLTVEKLSPCASDDSETVFVMDMPLESEKLCDAMSEVLGLIKRDDSVISLFQPVPRDIYRGDVIEENHDAALVPWLMEVRV